MRTLDELNELFRYKSDGKLDSIRILTENDPKGDCDDYGITAFYIMSGCSLLKFWGNILTTFNGRRLLFCKTKSGNGHAVCEWDGLIIDNIYKTWETKEHYEELGYKFESVNRLLPPIVALKMLIGKFA